MAVEVTDLAQVQHDPSDTPEETKDKLVLANEIIATIIRDLESLDARVTTLEP